MEYLSFFSPRQELCNSFYSSCLPSRFLEITDRKLKPRATSFRPGCGGLAKQPFQGRAGEGRAGHTCGISQMNHLAIYFD